MNLAPSGSGTRTLFHALLPHSKLARHDHLRTIERVAAERNDNASCFIITLREPVERIEAGISRHARRTVRGERHRLSRAASTTS